MHARASPLRKSGRPRGDTFKTPIIGEEHLAQIVLPDGFIWKKGDCGVGSFEVNAEDIHLQHTDTNWMYYQFDWSNRAPTVLGSLRKQGTPSATPGLVNRTSQLTIDLRRGLVAPPTLRTCR